MLPVPPPPAPTVPAPVPAAQVAAAERAFAADAAVRGTSAAFVAAFAEDGLVFAPRPVNARAHYAARPEDGSRLAWAPAYVEAAASGDFAVSTGPWSWCARDAAAPGAAGHFLTLWVRRRGRWRVRLDLGVSHPPQAEEVLRLVTRGSLGPGPGPEAAWRAFDAAAGRDLAAAFRAVGAADLRLYREGRAVVPGNLAVLAAGEAGAAGWEAQGREVAPSGDLAVRWGVRARGGVRGTALQVWRREPAGWRLIMDVLRPWP